MSGQKTDLVRIYMDSWIVAKNLAIRGKRTGRKRTGKSGVDAHEWTHETGHEV